MQRTPTMTTEYERGHAAGREAGIREAIEAIRADAGNGDISPGAAQWVLDTILTLLDAPAPAETPTWVSNCMICGRIVDTREQKDGGDPHGCEYDAGWVCSRECADALLDAPAPAGVTVQEAAKVLLGVVDRREWTHYPIEMPLNARMEGPAKVGKDAHYMTYEVWEADTLRSISDHNNLPDAIASWLRALSEGRT